MYNVTSNILIILWLESYLHVVEYKSIQQKLKTYLGIFGNILILPILYPI